MEKRSAMVNISLTGGTAAKVAKTCKVTLPTSWMDALGINETRREVELFFDGKQIVISPVMTVEEYAAQKLVQKVD